MLRCLDDFSMDYFRLDGKIAIVTCGNSGLGQAYALALAKAGANLIIQTYDTNWDETRKLIEKEGREVVFVKADLTKKDERELIIKIATEVYGQIDILVNNLESTRKIKLFDHTNDNAELIIERNLSSAYYLTQEISKIMVNQNSGKIINVSSEEHLKEKSISKNNDGKASIVSLTKKLAEELSKNNIQVNAIAPGDIRRKNIKDIQFNEDRDLGKLNRNSIEKTVESFDIMGAIVFLASRLSDYINGHILSVDSCV